MTRKNKQIADFEKILSRWRESLNATDAGNDRDRDSAILRFELAYEVCWKLLQVSVREEGLESNGPRQAFANAYRLGWIADEHQWDKIIKDRNLATHTYREVVANDLMERLPGYYEVFKQLYDAIPE